MGFSIISLVSVSFIVLLTSSRCMFNLNAMMEGLTREKNDMKDETVEIDQADYAPMIMEFIAALQKEQLRLKYEIGQDIYKIAQYQSANGTQENENQVAKLTSSINSFISEDFIAAKSLYDIQNNKINVEAGTTTTTTTTSAVSAKTMADVINGFKEIDQPTMDKFLIMVIHAENMQLFKLCLDNDLIAPGTHHYRTAVTNSKTDKQSSALNEIIERLATFDLDIKAYREDYPKVTFDKNFKVLDAQKLISENNFPMLRRLLDQGFNPSTNIPNIGSLLGFAVIEQCVKCVELLASKGADVNTPVEFNAEYRFKALGTERNPNGWTPLMIAAAHGNPHLVKALVASNKAEVTKSSSKTKDLNSRKIARQIVNFDLRSSILSEMKISPADQSRIDLVLESNKAMTLIDALLSKNIEKVDMLLIAGRTALVQGHLEFALNHCNANIVEALTDEVVPITNIRSIEDILLKPTISDNTRKNEILRKYFDKYFKNN